MKINYIYDVMGGVDDKFVSEAAVVRKKRPVLLIIAVTAAALALLVGAAAVYDMNSEIDFENDFAFNMKLKKYNITIPEDYMPTKENKYHYSGKVDIGLEELFEKFNAPLLITDKFSEEVDAENIAARIDVERWKVTFDYYLYSKSLDMNIYFDALYLTENADSTHKFGGDSLWGFSSYEVIKLRDGSDCAVCEGFADFSFNGVKYLFFIETDEPTIEMTMQVLEDLDIL